MLAPRNSSCPPPTRCNGLGPVSTLWPIVPWSTAARSGRPARGLERSHRVGKAAALRWVPSNGGRAPECTDRRPVVTPLDTQQPRLKSAAETRGAEARRAPPLHADQGFPRRSGIGPWEARFQRLGPRAGGGAERGTGGCRSSDVVMVDAVGTDWPLGGAWLGVCGSWSRMRHQRAAAGWSSGRGPAPAPDRTTTAASKPAALRLVNLCSSSGRNGSVVTLGTSVASSRHRSSALISASCMSSCCWKIRVA